MRLGCQECRSDVKSILKFNRSNDVSNSKWVSENSHSFIDQCCVGPNLTGRLTHAVWALTSLGGSVLLNSTLSGGGPPFRVFSETPRAFSQRALTSLSVSHILFRRVFCVKLRCRCSSSRARLACPLLDRSHFVDILCIFIEIC